MAVPVKTSAESDRAYDAILREVKASMAREDVTQVDLARRAGFAQSTVNRRMTGETVFTITELLDVCRVLGTTLTELVADARKHGSPRPGGDEGRIVAGAGFEPATSGLHAWALAA